MKFKNNKVIFIPKNKDVEVCVPRPQPSKKYIPYWFKEMPTTIKKINGIGYSGTAKKCMPFIDGLTSGYIQELACDIHIDSTNPDFITYDWGGSKTISVNFRPMSSRQEDSNSAYSMPHFPGYSKQEFHWNTFWEPKTPSGYSTFFFHPANRFDLPFITHNGIIDTDKWSGCGPLPFVIKTGFTGLIPAGTPIYQMLFIKRDSWNSEQGKYSEEYSKKSEYSLRRFLGDGYKKQIWSRKDYN
jgi:hypothetical protein